MNRALSLCVVAAALVLAVGCSSPGDRAAAQVNGTKISTNDVVRELNAIGGNQQFVDNLEAQQKQQGGAVRGATPGSYDPSFVATLLLRQINYELVHEEVMHRNIALTDECKSQARSDLLLDLGNSNAQQGEDVFDKFPKAYQDTLLQRNTETLALQNALAGVPCGSGDPATAFYNSHPEQFTQACLSLVVVPDQDTANAVVTQARAGADFGALAQQYSVDPETKAANGDAGCRLPTEFVPAVADAVQKAKPGDVTDAIALDQGFAVLKIGNKQLASLDDVRSQAEELASTEGSQSISDWLHKAQADAHVQVDPRYGTFDPASFTIKAPGPIGTTTTTTPAISPGLPSEPASNP